MRILFLQPGYAHYRDELFELLSRRHDIFFLYESSERTYPGHSKPDSISYAYAEAIAPKMPWIGTLYYLLSLKPGIIITSVPASLRTILAFCYCRILNKKLILWTEEWRHNTNPKSFKELLRRIKFHFAKIIYKNADIIVSSGSASYRFVSQFRPRRSRILMCIQSSNDLKHSHSKTDAYPTDTAKPKKTFIYVSRILDWKGLDILIMAFHRLKSERDDIALLVGGDGPFSGYCEKLCTSQGTGDITFIGKVDSAHLSQVLNRGNIFVLPSRFLDNRCEAWGLVINESMSMSLPIITTTAVGASFDMVKNGVNGIIVQEGSVDALYEGMKEILTMNLHEMGQNSRAIFEAKNSFPKMADAFTDAINTVQ
jgi:glycosyltransferase involved in cell wall biosynthesis